MYFMSKFCRLCVTTDGEFRNINSFDCDSVRFSEKLWTCTKMAVETEPWVSYLCYTCIKKLRVSYEFHLMCRKSTSILHQYLSELLTDETGEPPQHFENFQNSELRVSIKKLAPAKPPQVPRKQRTYVSKVVRCSLLKDLLTKIEDDKKQQELNAAKRKKRKQTTQEKQEKQPSVLRDLINFTKRYNYGYKLEENKIENVNFDCTPLDRLQDFVESYFRINFSCFHDNIKSVLDETEELLDDSDFDEMVNTPCPESPVKFEEVIIEPDINIKKEIFDSEEENEYNDDSYPNYLSRVKVEIKVEPDIPIITDTYLDHSEPQATSSKRSNSEIYPTLCQTLSQNHQSSLNLLQEFTEQRFKKQRSFSANSYKCRTRNHPFISPQLKNQFLNQDFSCGVCKRKFKSQGYLQAHYSKMKHFPMGT